MHDDVKYVVYNLQCVHVENTLFILHTHTKKKCILSTAFGFAVETVICHN